MKEIRFSRLLSVFLLFAASGCASYRMTTTMPVPLREMETPEGRMFRIASCRFASDTNAIASLDLGYLDLEDAEALRSRVSDEAVSRYSRMFTEEAGGIPLQVTLTRSGSEMDVGGDACVSCLTLTVFPLRSTDVISYQVDVAAVPARPVDGLGPVRFARRETSWMSIVPTAWIPVPGGEGQRAWGTDTALKMRETIMARSVVDAVVTALKRTEASAWPAP